MIPTSRSGPIRHPTMETARRENYDSGEALRPRIRRAALHLQRDRLLRALRAGGAEARLRRRPARRGGARRPRQPRRQRRDHRAGLGTRRTRQRLLARADRPGRALARALAAPARLPRRLARPARQGGRARRELRRETAAASSTCSRPIRARRAAASRSSSHPSPPGAASPTAASRTDALDSPSRAVSSPPRAPRRAPWRSPSRRPRRRAARRAASSCRAGRGSAARPATASAASSAITVVSPPSGLLAVAITVSEPPSRRLRAAASALRAACGCRPSRLSISTSACPPRAATRLAASSARSTAWPCESAEAAKLSAAAGASEPSCHSRDLLRPHADEHEADLEVLDALRARREQAAQRLGLAGVARAHDHRARAAAERRDPLDRLERRILRAEREPLARPGDREIVVARRRRRPCPRRRR